VRTRKGRAVNPPVGVIVRRVAHRVAQVAGVVAVALGGSQARGTADAHSDLDVALYYDARRPFKIAQLQRAVKELDDRHIPGLVTGLGAWGPGVNGGGWLVVGGVHVDLLYRDIRAVRKAIQECRHGQPSTVYQLGHPLGFHNQIYAGEVACCRPLVDLRGVLKRLKQSVLRYPSELGRALIDKHLFDAAFELNIADKGALRGDTMYVAGCLFRAAGFMALVVHALNRQWFLNEKGALAGARKFAIRPRNFPAAIEHVLANPGSNPAALVRSIGRMKSALRTLRDLAVPQG
jgi:predicted nucleotidyltransferase